jgi:glycosyltransferase involved in cell wall biosynthesis
MANRLELTILMPCLNEAETIGGCIKKAQIFLRRADVDGEVLIADNGSTDGSQAIATGLGARVCSIPRKGYGAALIGGIAAARGRYVIMGDSDDSYDFSQLAAFLTELRGGTNLVMGNRYRGGIAPGAMPPLHRYIGNPVLTFLGRLFFAIPIGDFHSGIRGFRREDIRRLNLQATGMEFASEMILRFRFAGHRITEVAVTLSPPGRSRPPHLRTWRDGWRHLKLLLMYSPRWLFFIPGGTLSAIGSIAALALFSGPKTLWNGVTLDLNTFIFACMAVVVGFQILTYGTLAAAYSDASGLLPPSKRSQAIINHATTDHMVGLAGVLLILGGCLLLISLFLWVWVDFGPLPGPRVPRLMVSGTTLIVLALQMFFGGFLLGIMAIPRRRDDGVHIEQTFDELFQGSDVISEVNNGEPQ